MENARPHFTSHPASPGGEVEISDVSSFWGKYIQEGNCERKKKKRKDELKAEIIAIPPPPAKITVGNFFYVSPVNRESRFFLFLIFLFLFSVCTTVHNGSSLLPPHTPCSPPLPHPPGGILSSGNIYPTFFLCCCAVVIISCPCHALYMSRLRRSLAVPRAC